jgi:hypothetical protein
MQVRYSFFDNDVTNDVSTFNLAKGRLIISGYAYSKDLSYMLQVAFEQSGNNKMLENAYLKYRFIDEVQLTGGQTKLVYSRDNMSSVGNLEFVAVSPTTTAFSPGYDLGAVVGGKVLGDLINYDLSVSNGAGQTSVRPSNGAQNNMALLAHLQINPLGAYGYSEGDPQFIEKVRDIVGLCAHKALAVKRWPGLPPSLGGRPGGHTPRDSLDALPLHVHNPNRSASTVSPELRAEDDMSDEGHEGKPPEQPKLRVTFAEGQVEGRYVNLAITTHTPTEFVLDFAFVPPAMLEAKVLARVLLNPVNAKRFSRALNENIRRYEQRYGEIDTNLGGPDPILH